MPDIEDITQGSEGKVFHKVSVWPHEVEPWFHSWYRGRVAFFELPHEVEPCWYRGTLDVSYCSVAT